MVVRAVVVQAAATEVVEATEAAVLTAGASAAPAGTVATLAAAVAAVVEVAKATSPRGNQKYRRTPHTVQEDWSLCLGEAG